MELATHHGAMRPFGDTADLGLDFGSSDRPLLVTALLAQCGEPSDAAFWWSQPVGLRIGALLRLLAATDQGSRQLTFTARCAQASCGETFEFEVPLHALPDGSGDDGPIRVQLDAERSVTLRRPTGDDLRRWREAQPGSRAEALHAMLDTLVIEGEVQQRDEGVLSRSIAAADPLVAFSVACRCPACGSASEVPIDLEAVALARLGAHQLALLREVHRFASHYGWTESEVLAVPSARRARYLGLIEDER
jgi:hypothetical protein